jgi:Cu(I)/Ag(I) efflux system membrane fusion protein
MSVRIFYIILVFGLMACGQEHRHSETINEKKYTCPMHPDVVQDKPGKCPVCGMDLIAREESISRDLMLSNSQIRLGNITTQKVEIKSIGQSTVINAKFVADETQRSVVSSRAAGRIEKLYFKETGRNIKKGEPLYDLYSEQLLVLQQEYLLAKEQFETLGKTEGRYESFFKAAARKLSLYGLTQKQIDDLSRSKSPATRITFFSPVTGVVMEINSSEGAYVSEGAIMYKIDDVRSLWLEAELYPGEALLVKEGDKISANVTGFSQNAIEGKIEFLSPEYSANSQITIMRASIQNPDLNIKPGMQAQVVFKHSSHRGVSISGDALIRDENGTHVYVQIAQNTFQPRLVKIGLEDFEQVEIVEGLKENEIVVSSGAYLLYSEIILKKGIDPVSGHIH